jgi:hypothetical protein
MLKETEREGKNFVFIERKPTRSEIASSAPTRDPALPIKGFF